MGIQKLQAVFFDFDGVVANTDPANRSILKDIIRTATGVSLTDVEYENHFAGKTLAKGVESYLAYLGQPEKAEAIIAAKKASDDDYIRLVEPYGDATVLIHVLKERGIMVCLATGAREEQVFPFLQKFGLSDVFDHIVTAKDYRFSKPNPQVYQILLERTGMIHAKENVAVIEDSQPGIDAAKAAELYCIAVTHTHPEHELYGYDEIVSDLTDLRDSGNELQIKKENE